MFNKVLIIVFVLTVMATVFMHANMFTSFTDAFCLRAKADFAVEDGLVSYWTLDKDDVEGETVKDVWGGSDGTIIGKANSVKGKVRDAHNFGGQGHVDVPTTDSLNITGHITVEAYINRSQSGAQHAIVEQYGCVGDAPKVGGFCLRVLNSNLICFYTLDNCGSGDAATGKTIIKDDTWYHVVATWDGKEIAIYVDGVLDVTLPTKRNPKERGMPLRIGAMGNNSSTQFNGAIDEVRVYNRALSETEVNQNMDAEGMAVEKTNKLAFTWGKIKASK